MPKRGCARKSRFVFRNPQASETHTLSLHDALPISGITAALDASQTGDRVMLVDEQAEFGGRLLGAGWNDWLDTSLDRKSTRLNSSHLGISYAVFCLKKKNIVQDAKARLRKERAFGN